MKLTFGLLILALPVLAQPTTVNAVELKIKVLTQGSIGDDKAVKNGEPPAQNADELSKFCPANNVISNAKELEKLCKAWQIDVPKVDFKETLVIVGTWKGTSFSAETDLTDGDLRIKLLGTKDLRAGFRYVLAACPRAGVKTVFGKELPSE